MANKDVRDGERWGGAEFTSRLPVGNLVIRLLPTGYEAPILIKTAVAGNTEDLELILPD